MSFWGKIYNGVITLNDVFEKQMKLSSFKEDFKPKHWNKNQEKAQIYENADRLLKVKQTRKTMYSLYRAKEITKKV